MDALSPRSANIQVIPRLTRQKEMAEEEAKRAEAAKKALKEKEYAPVPPEWVLQPPISQGGLAEKFRVGRCIGKGGFAMCYEGELRNKIQGQDRKIFALKVVKAKMSQKKMEEKVSPSYDYRCFTFLIRPSFVRSFRSTQRCDTRTLLNSIVRLPSEKAHTWSSSSAPMVQSWTWSRNEDA